jgi:MtN3 and saliva related transmembrane protein
MSLTEITGIAASIFTSSTLIPQVIKIIRERDAEGTSYVMLLVLFAGLSLWVVYGTMKNDWIIIIANGFSLLINMVTIVLKWKFGRPTRGVTNR